MNNLMEMMKSIKNPQEFIVNYAKQNSNPMLNNLIKMAEKNDINGLENFARNYLKEQGRDFDAEYSKIANMFK